MIVHSPSDRQFLVDSGASYHLISESQLTPAEIGSAKTLKVLVPMQTANGVVSACVQVRIFATGLNMSVNALVMPTEVPPVLSLGLLISENKFEYG